MSDAPALRIGFAGKRGAFWVLLASWLVPAMMICAYVALMELSDTDTTGKAWMAMGCAFVLVLWWVLRVLMVGAAMARAVDVGDAERVLELASYQLARKKGVATRAPFHIYRGLAHEIRGEWTAALAEIDAATPEALRGAAGNSWGVLAATVRIAALVETSRTAAAREVLDATLEPRVVALDPRRHASARILATLARGRVLWAEGAHEAALGHLERVIDDVRAGSGTRALAHAYAARCTADPAAAQRHRDRAKALAPGGWAARQT